MLITFAPPGSKRAGAPAAARRAERRRAVRSTVVVCPGMGGDIYLALGSNLGDRLGFLRRALTRLGEGPGLRLLAASPIFETDAVAQEPQPPYLNAVIRAASDRSARALLELCLRTEMDLGRHRPPGHGGDKARASRTIDLDVLLVRDEQWNDMDLQVPHPALLQRPFVRIPLACVAAPGLRHPVTGERLDVATPHEGVRVYADAASLRANP